MTAPASTRRRRATDPALRSRAIAAGLYTAVSALLAAVAAWRVYAPPGVVGAVARAAPGATMSSANSGDLVCVTAHAEVAVGNLLTVPLQASSCALAGGL